MHVIARILAVAYLVLAVFAGVVYVQAGVNYVNVTEVTLNIDGRVIITYVDILWSGNSTDDAVVHVFINVTNPGRVPIEVISSDFVLHMENPNDPRPWYQSDKLPLTEIEPGGFNTGRGAGTVVPAGETGTMRAVLTVQAGTERMIRFDRPDADGRYHPIVWGPRVIYTFVDFEITVAAYAPPYYDPVGVVPHV